MHKQCTCFAFAGSAARNIAITKKCLKILFRMGGTLQLRGGYPPSLNYHVQNQCPLIGFHEKKQLGAYLD